MSVAYKVVQWNRHKRIYDTIIAAAIVGYLIAFVAIGMALFRPPSDISPPILLMRALGSCGIILLHIILLIGPVHRLTPLAAPVLYNRRHLGVAFFCVAFLHALVAVGFYGGFGVMNPISAVLGHGSFNSIAAFPFEWLGAIALAIFFVMAATSHDFWLKNLGPRFWKSIHMGVYIAYAMVIAHVALGAMQSERSLVYPILMGVGAAMVAGAHLIAGVREARVDAAGPAAAPGTEWIDAGAIADIPEARAMIVCPRGGGPRDRIAIFRHNGALSAVANVCAHQGGPLGEGKIIDGCITCPWHGYQYLAHNGQSPPPFTEKIPTYQVRIDGNRVMVNPKALPPGTPVEPAHIPESPLH
jgi:nitrite reductase/ring-hydroxylating ferredoxin subunit/DMSO/TMAO reductase YedYZ heme-binding membrane subunit